MKDLEKRIENIEKKLNMEGSTVLTKNEKIVWDFILKNLSYIFEIQKYGTNDYSINATGFRYGIYNEINAWAEAKNNDLLKAFLSLDVPLYELKENKE